MPKKILIVAGESSGDFHGSSLIQALRKIEPQIEISGIGGPRMRRAGCKIHFDISELSIIGFTDVLKNLAKIKRVFRRLLNEIDAQMPDACILVDYPGFNLRLAAEVKKRNIPVIYYISPQIWAWWKGRIRTIQRYVDKMIVVFNFEEALYRQAGIDVSFVGHPLLDIAYPGVSRENFCQKLDLSCEKITIGLVPGSRKMEVERILPILLESAQIITKELPQTQFVLLKAPGLAEDLFSSRIKKCELPLAVCENQTYDFLNSCDFALVASGTATLETAIMQKPMLVVYKVSFLNWFIARWLIKLPFIGLVNVVAGKKIVPEFIQFQAKPPLIAKKALELLNNQDELRTIKSQLEKVRKSLGIPGASQRAAEIITNFLTS